MRGEKKLQKEKKPKLLKMSTQKKTGRAKAKQIAFEVHNQNQNLENLRTIYVRRPTDDVSEGIHE